MNKPTVLIADDHQILAEGVRRLLEGDFNVLGVVADGRELILAAQESRPDVIVADITMPSLNGIDAAVKLRDSGVKSKIVFLTQHRDVAYARHALKAGVSGFVLKHSVSSELVTAIREALQGKTYATPMIAGELLGSYHERSAGSGDLPPRLTARQREVLPLIAESRSAKQVTGALNISTRPAEAHKARILEVLGLHSMAELVQYAIRNGIISV